MKPFIKDLASIALIILMGVLCLSLFGCNGPTSPASAQSLEVSAPLHHNIPATMETGEPGSMDIIVWVCETQPRRYSTGIERDHYISRNRCPEVPIQ